VWALSAWLGGRHWLREEWVWWKRLGSAAPALVTRHLQRYPEIARRYQEFVGIFERAKKGAGWTDAA
jgi:hypothetical protein